MPGLYKTWISVETTISILKMKQKVKSNEYLGIIFQENGDISLAIKNLYSKALQAYFSSKSK